MRAVFYAKDGTEFEDRWDCEAYEEFLDHPALKGIIFQDTRVLDISKVKDYSDILSDSLYQNSDIVIVNSDEEVAALQWLASWAGWCEWEQITSPGTWYREVKEHAHEGKWINATPKNKYQASILSLTFLPVPGINGINDAITILNREEDQK